MERIISKRVHVDAALFSPLKGTVMAILLYFGQQLKYLTKKRFSNMKCSRSIGEKILRDSSEKEHIIISF